MLDWDNGDISTEKISIKLLCLYLVQHMLHQIKAQQIYTELGLSTVLSTTKIVEFKAFANEWFSSTFQGWFNFQGLFKKAV